jgi:membrane peptidoglycan carboxypeptidase
MRHHRSRFVVLALAIVALYAAAAWLFLLPPLRLPPATDLAHLSPSACRTRTFLDPDGQQRVILFVPLAAVPAPLIDALLRQEDEFRHHHGVDWVEALRAVYKDLADGSYRYGASTLTMQLMRELVLDKQRTLLRKAREVAYALQAERRYSKDEILELYLNSVHWGPGIHGIGAASCYYFGVPPGDLSTDEASRLVAVLPSPERLGPQLVAWARSRRA